MTRLRVFSDEQWTLIADLLPMRTGRRGRPFSDARSMVEGIVYRYRCGIAWRDVPEVFGPWQTIWTWHRRLAGDGTWDRILERLLAHADAVGIVDWAGGPDHRPRSPARHEHHPPHRGGPSNYTNPSIEPLDHAIGRSRGGLSTKIHHLVDGHGLPLVVLVSPGQSGDSPAFAHLLDHLRVPRIGGGRPRTRPDRIRGDKAYSSRANRELLRRRGIGAVIAEPSDQAGHRPSTRLTMAAETSSNGGSVI